MRGALSHVIGDMLGSFAALIAGGVILRTGWMPADPVLSAWVAPLVIRSGWRIARESAHLLLEGAPANLDAALVERELLEAAATVQIELRAPKRIAHPAKRLLAEALQFTVRKSMPPPGGSFFSECTL